MQRKYEFSESQEGSVLLIALIVLLLVSVLGLNTLTMTSTELKISGNDRSYKQNFYRAEAVIKEAAFALENSAEPDPSNVAFPWLSDGSDAVAEDDRFNPKDDSWDESGPDANASHSSFYTDNNAKFCALRLGVAPGSNQDMGSERKWEYVIYGRSELSSGQVDVSAGYLKKSE